MIKQAHCRAFTAMPSCELAGRSVSDIDTDLAEKADTAMHEDDEDLSQPSS